MQSFGLLAFLGLSLLANIAISRCSSRVYIVPLLKGEKCDGDTECLSLVKQFISKCAQSADNKRREEIGLLLPPYTEFTYCSLLEKDRTEAEDPKEGDDPKEIVDPKPKKGSRSQCETVKFDSKDAILNEKSGFDIFSNIERLFRSEQSSCLDESLAIFLTDIPCSEYDRYKDLDELFGSGFNKTAKAFNTEFYLHTIVGFLTSSENAKNERYSPCVDLRDHSKANNESHIELRTFEYSKMAEKGQMCELSFKNLRNGDYHRTESSSFPLLWVIIGCSAALLLAMGTLTICCVMRFHPRRAPANQTAQPAIVPNTTEHKEPL